MCAPILNVTHITCVCVKSCGSDAPGGGWGQPHKTGFGHVVFRVYSVTLVPVGGHGESAAANIWRCAVLAHDMPFGMRRAVSTHTAHMVVAAVTIDKLHDMRPKNSPSSHRYATHSKAFPVVTLYVELVW